MSSNSAPLLLHADTDMRFTQHRHLKSASSRFCLGGRGEQSRRNAALQAVSCRSFNYVMHTREPEEFPGLLALLRSDGRIVVRKANSGTVPMQYFPAGRQPCAFSTIRRQEAFANNELSATTSGTLSDPVSYILRRPCLDLWLLLSATSPCPCAAKRAQGKGRVVGSTGLRVQAWQGNHCRSSLLPKGGLAAQVSSRSRRGLGCETFGDRSNSL